MFSRNWLAGIAGAAMLASTSFAALVCRAVEIAERHERPIAGAKQAREMLGLGPLD